MKHNYKIIDGSDTGFPFVEVYGDNFCYEDLYEFSGKNHFVTTFKIKLESDSYSKFGESLTGVIIYNPKETEKLIKQSNTTIVTNDKLKINHLTSGFKKYIKPEIIEDLRYGGLNISDIESICVLMFKEEQEFHETGEKKLPNIIEVEIPDEFFRGINNEELERCYLVTKNNDGVKLAGFEKENLVGIMLALNNGHIDSRILKHLGFDRKTMSSNLNIKNRYYQGKERQGLLTDIEKKEFEQIKKIILAGRIMKLFQEIKKTNANKKEINQNQDIINEIINCESSFQPKVLLHGKVQVYWNVDSYIHIVMRHFKKYQIGHYKTRTPFSYKLQDLENLIEKVLSIIRQEYETHVSNRPTSDFKRIGSMAVEFNGNHYALQIAPDGRLEQFHANK